MTIVNPAPETAYAGLCQDCKPFAVWVQSCIASGQTQQVTPNPFANDEIQLGPVSEIITRKDCKLCHFIRKALEASFDPPLPLQYTTFTGTWDDQITIDPGNLAAKPHGFEVGFDMKLSSLSAVGVTPFAGIALNEEQITNGGYKFYPIVRLIADDAPLVPAGSKKAIRLGRLVNPTQCNIREICHTYLSCVNSHRGICDTPRNASVELDPRIPPPSPPLLQGLRLVDVKNKCIVKVQQACRYVALSYVWGRTPFLQLRLANVAQLETPGMLGSQHANLPRTLWEAMSLTEMLGERYLWIDAICIIQDDDSSKMDQIAQMDLIYLHACLTIVAGDGVDANAGLSGFTPGSRSFNQNIVNIAGLRFASCTAPILKAFDRLKWHSRAWTYQEFMLSKRLLVFTDQQVYYNCNLQSYSEDSVILNKPQDPLTEELVQKREIWNHPQFKYDPRLQVNSVRAIWNSSPWHSYMSLVQEITARDITMHADILRAVTGVLASMTRYTGEEFVCGLPSSMLEVALMWQPLGPLRRRGAAYSGHPFPTWSWAGWEGKIRHVEEYSPHSVHPIIHDWELHIPKGSNRPRPNDSTNLLEWTQAEIMHDFTPYCPNTIEKPVKTGGTHNRTTWKATAQSAPTSKQPPPTGKEKLKSFWQKISAPSNPPGPPPPRPFVESALLHFPAQTKSLLIDPTPTPFFHKPQQNPSTSVFRILNHAHQWVGTIHLALPPPFGSATAPVPAEFLAIGLTYDSFEDTNKVNPGPNVGQNSFDVNMWRSLDLPKHELRLLNVLWIQWVGDVAQRVGAGQVHVDAWPVGGVVNRQVWLG